MESWEELGRSLGLEKALSVSVGATESEFQLARKEVRTRREDLDRTLLQQALQVCSTSGRERREEDVEELLHLDFGHFESAPGSNLKALLEKYRAVSAEISQSRDRIESVQKVADWWSNFEECQKQKRFGNFSKAVGLLEKLKLSEGDGLENLPGRERFESEFVALNTALSEEIRGNLRSLFRVEVGAGEVGTLIVPPAIEEGAITPASDLWLSCQDLGLLPSELQMTKATLIGGLVAQILDKIECFEITHAEDDRLRWTLSLRGGDSTCLAQLGDYCKLVVFLWHAVYGGEECCRRSALECLWYPLEGAMRRVWAAAFTEENLGERDDSSDILAKIGAMEARVSGSGLAAPEDEKILSNCLRRHLDSLLEGAKTSHMARARDLVVAMCAGKGSEDAVVVGSWEKSKSIAGALILQGYTRGHGCEATSAPAREAALGDLASVDLGALVVSRVSTELVSIMESAMVSGRECKNPEMGAKLVEVLEDIAELWVNVPALLQRQELESIARLVMIYFNDTAYLASAITGLSCRGHSLVQRCDKVGHLTSRVDRMTRAAFALAYGQVRGRTAHLQSLIGGQNLFRNAHKASQKERIASALSELRMQTERLANIWKSVLAPEHFATFFGAILENVCTTIYAEILSTRDISVQETEILPELLLILVGDGLGPFLARRSPGQPKGGGGGGTFASLFERYAPGWAKVCALVDLFSMSLEQILDGWTAGGLRAALTSDEVVHFISIVFEESALRTDKVTAILATDPAMAAT